MLTLRIIEVLRAVKTVRRSVCFITCFALILSNGPAVPKTIGGAAGKSKVLLTQGPPGLNLPNLNEARRMNTAPPKIAPPVSAASASKIEPSASASLPVQEDNWPMALIAQENRVGTGGEDLLSRNFNWGVPIVSLPGRAGMDLNLGLYLNSLIWTKSGTNILFNLDKGFPSPGFRLGLPELGTTFYNPETGTGSALLTMPSGQRYEFRRNTAYNPSIVYEEMGSTHMLLVVKINPLNEFDITWTLLLPDGATYKFKTIVNNFKCIEIKDRNGNYISITYTPLEQINTITETLGRVVNFNYDGSNRLISITQNWSGNTHTYATFAYDNVTIQTNFPGLDLVGAANGTVISALSRVDMADGKVYAFEYNTYAQVETIKCFAPNSETPDNFPDDYTLLSSISYDLTPDAGAPQSDCPRFFSRIDWAKDWNSGVLTSYAGDGATWGSATSPDGTVYKEFFGVSGWQRGLTLRTETWSNDSRKKRTTSTWVNDNLDVSYWLNPRVVETNVYDENGKQRRTTIDYADFGAVSDIREYEANASTVLRHTHFEYLRGTAYTGNLNRRLTQLVTSQTVYDGSGALFSKVTYGYDLADPKYLVHQGPPIRHDTAKYGPTFVQGRGNLNEVRRWDVTAPTDIKKSVASTIGYNTSGSMIFSRDPLNHGTSLSYTDSFSDSVNRNTFAYLTKMTDADEFSSMVQYNYDFGAVMRTQDPKEAVVVNTYDSIGRLDRVTNQVNGAYTRYVYAPNHLSVQSFTTVNDLSSEFYQITVFDGHGRTRSVASDHPGSAGGYKAQNFEYDFRGRMVRQSNPTETNVNWEPAGDDAAGRVWIIQAYDWQGRPTVSTNQDGTTKEISYEGCGCAGGQVVVMRDEVGRRQKVYSDVLGRVIKTEDLLPAGGVYRTTTTKYNVRDQVEEIKSVAGSAGAFRVVTNEYDGHGWLWRRKLPIEGAGSLGTRFNYNNDDTINTVTDPRNVVSTYTYNARKLVTGVSFNTGGNPDIAGYGPLSFTYDENGNRLTMIDGAGSTTYHYDSLSRMDWERRYFNNLSQGYYIYYTYNLAGQVKEIRDHFNDVIYYNLDAAGQVTSVAGADLTRGEQYQFTSSQPGSRITYRAWGGLKHMTAGNGVKTNITYDQAMRIKLFEVADVRNPHDTQLAQVMKAEHEYYGDGKLRYVKDHLAPTYDRAYKWDHVGRLEDAYTGQEAREFAGKPAIVSYGPYRQTYQHDVWGNLTSRVNRFWSESDTMNASFTSETGRNPNWSYDAAGNLTQDNTLRYLYDAAGFNWKTLNLSNNQETTQLRDGDGNVVKHGCGGYLNSTVLGGRSLTEISCVGNKTLGNVYLGEMRVARLITIYTIPWDKWVNWSHVSPVTGSQGRTDEHGWYWPEAELDPMGVNIKFDDPFIPPDPPPDPGMEPGIPEPLPVEVSPEDGRNCFLDGFPVNCARVASLLRSEAAVVTPTRTQVPVYDGKRYVGFAFWNGQAANASENYEFTYSFFYEDGGFHPETGEPTLGYAVGNAAIRATRATYVDVMAGEFIGGGGLFQSKKPERIIERKKIDRPDKATPDQAPSCDPRGNSGSSSPGGTGPAAGQLAHTGARVGTGARTLTGVGAVAGTATGGTALVLIGIGTLGYLVMNRGPKLAPDNNPHPPKPSACPTPVIPEAKDKWRCTASCNLHNFGNVPLADPRVTGEGTGSNQAEACLNAKRVATQSAPPGTYARHCQCDCGKR